MLCRGNRRRKGEKSTIWTEYSPAFAAPDGPVKTLTGFAVDGFLPVAQDGFVTVSDDYVAHFYQGFAGRWRSLVFEREAFSAIALHRSFPYLCRSDFRGCWSLLA